MTENGAGPVRGAVIHLKQLDVFRETNILGNDSFDCLCDEIFHTVCGNDNGKFKLLPTVFQGSPIVLTVTFRKENMCE